MQKLRASYLRITADSKDASVVFGFCSRINEMVRLFSCINSVTIATYLALTVNVGSGFILLKNMA